MVLQTSSYSGQRHPGEKHGEGMFPPSPADYGIWESVVSCLSGFWGGAPVANNFFTHLLVHLTTAWKWEIPTSLYWLGLMSPFNFFGCRTPQLELLVCPDTHDVSATESDRFLIETQKTRFQFQRRKRRTGLERRTQRALSDSQQLYDDLLSNGHAAVEIPSSSNTPAHQRCRAIVPPPDGTPPNTMIDYRPLQTMHARTTNRWPGCPSIIYDLTSALCFPDVRPVQRAALGSFSWLISGLPAR